jgi:hypothetical protein
VFQSRARRWRIAAVTTVLAGSFLPLTFAGPANAAPINQTDIQMHVVSRGPVPGKDQYRITIELHNNGPRDITEVYKVHTVFRTVVASSTGTTTTETINTDSRPRPQQLADDGVDIKSIIFAAPGGCRNIGCDATIRLTHEDGTFIADHIPNNDTVRVIDGVIVQQG